MSLKEYWEARDAGVPMNSLFALGSELPPRVDCRNCGKCTAVFVKGQRVNVGRTGVSMFRFLKRLFARKPKPATGYDSLWMFED